MIMRTSRPGIKKEVNVSETACAINLKISKFLNPKICVSVVAFCAGTVDQHLYVFGLKAGW